MRSSTISFLLSALLATSPAGAVPAAVIPRAGAADRYDLPLTWNSFGFLSSIKIGTPQMTLPVFVDWTWIDMFVLSPKCYGQMNPSACLNAKQIAFDESKSSTFKNLSSLYAPRRWLPNHFFEWEPLVVEYGSDALSVGPVNFNSVIQLSDTTFDLSAFPFPFSGVFGLSPVFKGDKPDYQSPFYQSWSKGLWKSPQIGFVYCYNDAKKPVCGGHDGIQSLGGIRTDLIKNNKIYWYDNKEFPDVNSLDFFYTPGVYNYWATELNLLKIGGEVQPIEPTSKTSGQGAIFDHASYGRGTPLTVNAYSRLIALTQAKAVTLENPPNNGNQSWYAVDCAKTTSYPPISYRFCGHDKEWTVTPQHYVEQLADGSCVLNVRTLPLATGNKFIGNFGETFAKDKYIVFDFQKLKLGIAEVNW